MRGKRGFFGHADSRVRLFCRRLTGKQRILLAGTASFLLAASCCLLPVLDSLLYIPFRGAGPKTGNGTYPFRRVPAGKNKKHSFKHP